MKHLFSKKSQTARRVWTQIGAIAIIAAITVAGFSCKNLTSSAPNMAISGGGKADTSNMRLLGLSHATGAEYTSSMPFENAPGDTSYTLTVDADVVTVWINPEVDIAGAAVTYQTRDDITGLASEKLETIGVIKLDVSEKSEMSLILFIGAKRYSIKVYKNAPGAVVYVSQSGDGSGNDNDDGLRGLLPETAFYSLHKAVEKAVGLGDYKHVVVLGVLKQDNGGTSSDTSSVFQISNTNGKRLVISAGVDGSGLSAEGSAAPGGRAKRVLSISGGAQVELQGLTISGSGKKNATEFFGSFAAEGAGILASGTGTAVTLRAVKVTGNTAQGAGGGIYIDNASVELGEGTRVYENSVELGASYGTSVYYNRGTLTFSGDGAALRVDTTASAINDAVLGKVPDTVYVTDTNKVTVGGTALPLIDSTTYHGLAAYIVLSPEGYVNEAQILQGGGITGDKTNNRFMRFRSFGGARLWAINESGKLASSESYYVGATTEGIAGSDYYDGLTPDTAFNSLECALAYANAAINKDSFINRKLTILSELTADNHTDSRYPGVLSGDVTLTSGKTALFDITFDGKAQNRDGYLEPALDLLCAVDIEITASATTLKFACNFTDAMLTFVGITLYESTYKRSQVYADATFGVVKAEDVVFSDDLQVGGTFVGTAIVDAAETNPVVFKRALSNGTTSYFNGPACDVTVKFGQLYFMGNVQSLTINDGLVTDEHNPDTDSTATTVQLIGGKLVVKKIFTALVNKYPEGTLSFEGGYIPIGGNTFGVVLQGDVNVANSKAIETHDAEAYFGATLGQSFVAKIYLDRGAVSELRGYKAFDFDNFVSGSDATALANRGKTVADVAALYELVADRDQYDWQIGADSANTKTLGLLGRTFIVGDLITHEKTYYKDPGSIDENWKPLPSELVERTSVVYKTNGNEVWKAVFWGYLTDDHNPTNHDSNEEDDEKDKNWFGTTGNAERADGYGTIPGGTSLHDGHWGLPKETDGGYGVSVGPGTNNIRQAEWAVIKTALDPYETIPAHKLKNHGEVFWTEASMGTTIGYAAYGFGGGLVVAGILSVILILATGPVGVAGYALVIGLSILLGEAVSMIIMAGLTGKSMYEQLYSPSQDDYATPANEDSYFPVILIQRFDNYVCFDPEPVHAL
ncbi:MAG: hypothetical protein Ta2A_14540 [Treponemataceae bacterium]|nr:MAG: hypothetical protein Ta2A_14540 [Treponemataceae bacterium]